MKNKLFLSFVALLVAGICGKSNAMSVQNDSLPVKVVSKSDSIYTKITGKERFECKSVVNVITKGDTFYVEMPVELMGREFLVTNRLQKVQQELNDAGVNKGIVYQKIGRAHV